MTTKSSVRKLFSLIFILSIVFSITAQQKSAVELYNLSRNGENLEFIAQDSIIELAASQAIVEKNDTLLAKIYYYAAKLHNNEGLYEKAGEYYQDAIDLAQKLNKTELLVKYKARIAGNYLEMGDMNSSVKLGLEAIETAKKYNLEAQLPECYTAVAETYRKYDYYDLALEYNSKALAAARAINNEHDLGRSYNNLSAVLGEMGRNIEAIDSLKKGLSIISDSNLISRAFLNSNIGFCYRNIDNYQKALEYNRIALRYKTLAKMKKSIPYSLGAIGRAYLGMEQFDSALYYIQQRWILEKEYNNFHGFNDASTHLSEVYLAKKDYKNAYKFAAIRDSMSQVLFETETEHKVVLYQRKYDLSKKEAELTDLKNKQLLEKAQQKNIIIVLLSLLVFSALLIVIFRYRSAKNEQKRKVIELKLKAKEVEEIRNKEELKRFTKDLVIKNKAIRNLNDQISLKEQQINEFRNSKSQELEELQDIRILTDEDWKRFKVLFEKVYPGFFNRLNSLDFSFTKGEKRLLALARLDMDNQQIADALGISSESVSKSKFRLKKKILDSKFQSVEELAHSI